MSRRIPIRNLVALLCALGGGVLVSFAVQQALGLRVNASEDLELVDASALARLSGAGTPCPGETADLSARRSTRGADLNVFIRASGSSSIRVAPGSEISYEVVGELSDSANEGLALFRFDLEFDGGDLPQADTPTHPPMTAFAIPDGVTNPAGFGGTVDMPGREGDLVQIGGGQNTIQNTVDHAPYPVGSVIPGVAWPGSPEVLVTGTLTAPVAADTYTLRLTNLAARVIKPGETGVRFWATEPAQPGAVADLTITVLRTGDCNGNDISDECDIACDPPGGPCDVPGCGESEDANGNGTPDECEATTQLTLNADGVCFGWVEPDSTITVRVDLTGATAVIVGGDFFMQYDNTLLDFESIVPGDSPFTVEISEVVDEAAGTIDYGVGIGFGDTGTSQDSTMAVITFTAVAEVCDTANLVSFDPLHTPPTMLGEETGQPIDPALTDLSPITIDSEDPTITCPSDVSTATDPGVCYMTNAALGTPTTGDNCGVDSVSHDAPAQFPIGTTVVTWNAVDTCGATATCTQNVTVTDDEPPTITCPGDVSVSADPGACYATNVNLGTATTGDNCGVDSVSHDAPAQFSLGTTVVTWTVQDTAGHTTQCTQNVTVTDDELPTINCPGDVSVSADPGACYAANVNLGTATTSDNCGVDSVSNDASAQLPVGSTMVTWTVQDTAGHTAQCTQNVTVTDDELPTISGCPADFTVYSDAGGCDAVVTWPEPMPQDNCAIDTFTSTHDSGSTFSAGTTTVTYTAADIQGNSSTCMFEVTLNPYNNLAVTVELSPVVETPLTRCITLELWECSSTEPTAIVSAEFTFTDVGGGVFRATETVLIPCGDYECITARDELHTLQRRDENFGIPIGETYYLASFTGDVLTGGDWLVGGNLNDDSYIDILDYSQFVGQWNTPRPADTPCGTPHPHADINGDGIVSTADFTFIQTNYWHSHEDDCCSRPDFRSTDGPLGEISVKDLRKRGLGHLSIADLNSDGWVDAGDLAAFVQGVRPEPAARAKRVHEAGRAR